VFAPPRVLRAERAAIAAVIAALPHGTIALNTWTGLGYGLGTTPWGIGPQRPIEHGSGWTRNLTGVPAPQRVVVTAPFRPRPLPPWLPGHRSAAATLRAFVRHTLQPSWLRLAATACHACLSP
jgi:aldehyde dehydrogenase (NAD(P)+)